MSLNQIKRLLNTAIDHAIDNKELDIPDDYPEDVINEIKSYFRGLNYMAAEPFFDIVTIKDMKKEATKTYHIIKRKTEDAARMESESE